VIDFGAGMGSLTEPLLAAGARVIAVELHPQRAAHLRQRFASANCHVIEQDIARFRLPAQRFSVVANPPFEVVAQLLRLLTCRGSRLERADIVVPLQVAARWSRGAGLRPHSYRAKTVRRLSPHAFVPKAQPTAVLRIERSTHSIAR
jgi:23S rRNA (adenine-N6)-dimethyltransferase